MTKFPKHSILTLNQQAKVNCPNSQLETNIQNIRSESLKDYFKCHEIMLYTIYHRSVKTKLKIKKGFMAKKQKNLPFLYSC